MADTHAGSGAMSQSGSSSHAPCEAEAGWIMVGHQLDRFGMQVPANIVKDTTKFVTMRCRALAQIGQDVIFCERCPYATDVVTKRMELAFQLLLDVELRYGFSEAGLFHLVDRDYDGPCWMKYALPSSISRAQFKHLML